MGAVLETNPFLKVRGEEVVGEVTPITSKEEEEEEKDEDEEDMGEGCVRNNHYMTVRVFEDRMEGVGVGLNVPSFSLPLCLPTSSSSSPSSRSHPHPSTLIS